MSTGSSSSPSRAQSTLGSVAQTAGVFLSAAAPKPKTSASDPSPDGDGSESGGGAGRDWNTRADWLEVFVIGFITVVWGVMFIGKAAGFLQPGPAYDQLTVLVVALVSQYIGMSRNEREQEKIR